MTAPIFYIDAINATTQYNFCLMHQFASAGLQVRFLTSKFLWEKDFPEAANSECFFFNKSTWLCEKLGLSQRYRRVLRAAEYPINLQMLVKRVRKENPAVVHFNWSRLPGLDIRAICRIKQLGIPVCYTAHNHLPHDSDEKHKQIFIQLYQLCDHIVVLTDFVKKRLIDSMQIEEKKITIIPHTNYQPIVDLYPSTESQARDKNTLLFFGQIHPYKGLDLLLEAFAELQDKHPDLQLKVLGNAYQNMSIYTDMIRSLNLQQDRIHFDTRFVSMEEGIEAMRRAALLILPYRRSSQSGVVPLANTVGLPVVATAVGGLPEMIRNGDGGYLTKPDDAQDLATGVDKALQHVSRSDSLYRGAREAVSTLFSEPAITASFQKLYQNLAEATK